MSDWAWNVEQMEDEEIVIVRLGRLGIPKVPDQGRF